MPIIPLFVSSPQHLKCAAHAARTDEMVLLLLLRLRLRLRRLLLQCQKTGVDGYTGDRASCRGRGQNSGSRGGIGGGREGVEEILVLEEMSVGKYVDKFCGQVVTVRWVGLGWV